MKSKSEIPKVETAITNLFEELQGGPMDQDDVSRARVNVLITLLEGKDKVWSSKLQEHDC